MPLEVYPISCIYYQSCIESTKGIGEMIPKIESWTVVIPGAWNSRIFSPEWMVKNLFEGAEKVQIEISFEPGNVKIRLSTANLVLIPADNKFIIGVKSTEDENLQKAEKVAQNLLNTLPHTPITGFGINFGFEEHNPSEELNSLFVLHDLTKIGTFGGRVSSSEITRKLIIDTNIINVKHSLDEEGHFGIHLNFHNDANSTEAARDKLSNIIIPCRDITYNLLKEIYNLTLDEENNI
jgi:hypothetical protein